MSVATHTAVPALKTAARARQYWLSVRLENQSVIVRDLLSFSITGINGRSALWCIAKMEYLEIGASAISQWSI
jgi:hypothetical protein